MLLGEINIMPRNLSSTCNSKINPIRDRMDHADHQKLPHSESKVREISKPVKIAQLRGLSKKSQTDLRDSTVKISQPERITPYVKNTSTQKKNGTNMISCFHHSERNVRRNLKFTETPPTARKTKQVVRTSTNNSHDKSTLNKRSSQSRKSFILPPDSIKNLHVAQNRFKQSKSMFPHLNQTRILSEKSVSKYPRISEGSESSSPVVEVADELESNPVAQEKNNKTSVIQHTSSQTFEANDRPVPNISHAFMSHSNANNDAVKKATREHSDTGEALNVNVCSNVTVGKLQVLSMHDTDAKKTNLYNSSYLNLEANAACTPGVEKITIEDAPLQAIKRMSESYAGLQRDIDDDCEYVTLSKKELTVLTSNLESYLNLICRLEKNISCLKLTSTNVINLLSAKTADKMTNDNETESKKIENFGNNAKVTNNADTMSSSSNQAVVVEVDRSSEDASTKILGADASVDAKTDVLEAAENHMEAQSSRQTDFTPVQNKENEKDTSSSVKRSNPRNGTRRRSARLMAKALRNSNADNDSFLNLEHELNIVSKQPVTPIVSRMDHTPLTSGRRDKKTGRPWKEYMAMKSRMSCLLTPNIKRYNSPKSTNNMHSETGGVRCSLSNKILADLQNLYSDSPDL